MKKNTLREILQREVAFLVTGLAALAALWVPWLVRLGILQR